MDEQAGSVRPSKSARKREFEALQALADQMTGLSDQELRRLGVAQPLREAIARVRSMRPSGARNRQLKHCVRYMDNGDLDGLRAYLVDRQSQRVAANQVFHAIEGWRDRLTDEGDAALAALFDAYPGLDRQRIRQLCRDAMRERVTGKPAGAGRRLFRHLNEALSAANPKKVNS
jgi:ribosome-associated protein